MHHGLCCISFDSYIKPQRMTFTGIALSVVYLLIPTSNHNRNLQRLRNSKLYIFWFLHQTTTMSALSWSVQSCISFDSYIKPQLKSCTQRFGNVVYLLIPTSNHNFFLFGFFLLELYIFWFLHQTTTCRWALSQDPWLYIFWFLHQTTTISVGTLAGVCCISFDSYIKPQRLPRLWELRHCCISFDSYIKPQLGDFFLCLFRVVYLLIPTSNHNSSRSLKLTIQLYIFWFLHQTTTPLSSNVFFSSCISFDSYIKPQRDRGWQHLLRSCISFDSYIKPQPLSSKNASVQVVYLLIPTSNHNFLPLSLMHLAVVYLLIPTSNHNCG